MRKYIVRVKEYTSLNRIGACMDADNFEYEFDKIIVCFYFECLLGLFIGTRSIGVE